MNKTVYLPRARDGEEAEVFVAVNGRAWRIRKGAQVQVPQEVAEVLENAQVADSAIEAFLQGAAERTVGL